MRRDARLAEEEEDAAVYGHQRADGDEDIEVERASSRGKKKLTLGKAQAEEAQQKLVEREKRRICEDFEVTAQRLQDVTNSVGTRASLPPLNPNVFGISFSIL